MKKILTLLLLSVSLLLAAGNKDSDAEAKVRLEKQIQKELQNEKKYAEEQTFYRYDNYDFKGAQVNEESLEGLPEIENLDDFNMDSTYD